MVFMVKTIEFEVTKWYTVNSVCCIKVEYTLVKTIHVATLCDVL